MARFEVVEISDHPCGYSYNVQLWTTQDDGKTWNYCGVGRFCRTMKDVINYIKNY